jgi:hypothetical protein
MSDVEHPNWWQASDGKWYPPESNPGVPANQGTTWITIQGSTFRKCLLCGEEFSFTHFRCRKRDPITGRKLPKLEGRIANRIGGAIAAAMGAMPAETKAENAPNDDFGGHEKSAGKRNPIASNDLRNIGTNDLEHLIVRITNDKAFSGQLREPNPHPVMTARELLLQAVATPETDKAHEMLLIALELLARTSSLSFTSDVDRMFEIESASFWRGVIGGILNNPETESYFDLNFLDVGILASAEAIDRTTALRKIGRNKHELAEWKRFVNDPSASEDFRLAIKSFRGAGESHRVLGVENSKNSVPPGGPSSFLLRKPSADDSSAILGSSTVYEFRQRLLRGK